MINSKFILNILDLLLDGDQEGILARPQINFLTVKEQIFTGPGTFIFFLHITLFFRQFSLCLVLYFLDKLTTHHLYQR